MFTNIRKMKLKGGEEVGVEEYEHALSLTGFGRYNVGLMLVSGGCLMSFFIETLSMAYVLPGAECDLDLTLTEKSILTSISFIGIVLSSPLWGFIGDRFGRKKVIMITTYLSSLFGFASSFVPNVWLFILFRFLNGFLIGCPISVVIAYVGEFHSDKYRAKVILWAGSIGASSSMILPSLAWLILSMNWALSIPFLGIIMRPWRLLVFLYSVSSFTSASFLFLYPESPKYLWSIGKSEETLAILRRMYSVNTKNPETQYPITNLNSNKKENEDNLKETSNKFKSILLTLQSIWAQISPLFRKPLLTNTFLTSLLQFGVLASANGIYMWVPEMFNKIFLYENDNPNEALSLCKVMSYDQSNITIIDVQATTADNCANAVNQRTFIITIIFGVVYTFLYIILGFIVNIFGKKLLTVLILLISAFAGIGFQYVENYIPLTVLMCIFLMNGLCINLIQAIIVELFPTQNRAMAISIAQMIGRFGAVLGSYTTGLLLRFYCMYTFLIYAALSFILIIATLFLPIPFLTPSLKCK